MATAMSTPNRARDPWRAEPDTKPPLISALRKRCGRGALWLLIAYFCMSMLAMNALMTHMISHLLDIGIAAGLAAIALSVMTGVMTFTQLGAGFIGMRYSMLSIAVSGEVLKIAGVFILIFTRSVPVIFLSMVILGIGSWQPTMSCPR